MRRNKRLIELLQFGSKKFAQSPPAFDIDKNLLEDIDWDKLNEKFKNILI